MSDLSVGAPSVDGVAAVEPSAEGEEASVGGVYLRGVFAGFDRDSQGAFFRLRWADPGDGKPWGRKLRLVPYDSTTGRPSQPFEAVRSLAPGSWVEVRAVPSARAFNREAYVVWTALHVAGLDVG